MDMFFCLINKIYRYKLDIYMKFIYYLFISYHSYDMYIYIYMHVHVNTDDICILVFGGKDSTNIGMAEFSIFGL